MNEKMFPELNKWNLIGKIKRLLSPNGRYVIDADDNIIRVVKHAQEWNTPWVHIYQDPQRCCNMLREIFVQCLGFIPKKCQECWKVIFRPQTLRDMFNMKKLMERLHEKHHWPCKLGSEGRIWTSGVYGKWGLWGCYWYNNSQKAGMQCWEIVKDAITADETLKHLMDDVDEDGYPERLVLKRGCTEFEIGQFGDSLNWAYGEDYAKWERIVWSRFEKQIFENQQSEEEKNEAIDGWFKHAHHAGDQTVKEFNEGTMLWRSTRYYHKECFEKIKKQRAVAKSLKKNKFKVIDGGKK